MPRPASEVETARLEARVPVNVYEQMQRAARLRGMTLTGYLIATAGEDARRTVEEADVLRLAAEDQVRFAKALIDLPAPNARLARAAKRHVDLDRAPGEREVCDRGADQGPPAQDVLMRQRADRPLFPRGGHARYQAPIRDLLCRPRP